MKKGNLPPSRFFLPEESFFLKRDVRACPMFRDVKRTSHRHFFLRRLRGKHCHRIEQLSEPSYGRCKDDFYFARGHTRVTTLPLPERNASPVVECRSGSISCCTV